MLVMPEIFPALQMWKSRVYVVFFRKWMPIIGNAHTRRMSEI